MRGSPGRNSDTQCNRVPLRSDWKEVGPDRIGSLKRGNIIDTSAWGRHGGSGSPDFHTGDKSQIRIRKWPPAKRRSSPSTTSWKSSLTSTSIGKTGKLSRRPLVRTDAADMLKRRLKQAGLPAHYSPHSFRATGITNFLENDGTLEAAQRIADHADSRTTKLYDRRGQKVLLEDMERIRY
jgi:integrase